MRRPCLGQEGLSIDIITGYVEIYDRNVSRTDCTIPG